MSPKKRLGVTVISTVWSNVSLKTIVVVAEPQNSPFHTTANLGSRSVTEPCSRHLPEEETEAQRHALASSGAEPGTLAQLAAGARFFLLLKVGLASHGRPDGPELPKALTFMTAKAGGHRDSTRESMVSSKETGGGGAVHDPLVSRAPRPLEIPRATELRHQSATLPTRLQSMLGVAVRGRSAAKNALIAQVPGSGNTSVRTCVVKKLTGGFGTVPLLNECLLNFRKRQPRIKPYPGLVKPFQV